MNIDGVPEISCIISQLLEGDFLGFLTPFIPSHLSPRSCFAQSWSQPKGFKAGSLLSQEGSEDCYRCYSSEALPWRADCHSLLETPAICCISLSRSLSLSYYLFMRALAPILLMPIQAPPTKHSLGPCLSSCFPIPPSSGLSCCLKGVLF